MPDLTLEQVEKIVENSFNQAMEFNDKRAKLGTDAHKIAEIIFSNPSLVYKQEILDEIRRLLKTGELEFETDFYEDETDKIAATLTLIVNDIQAEKLVAAEYSGKIHAIFEKRGN